MNIGEKIISKWFFEILFYKDYDRKNKKNKIFIRTIKVQKDENE
jgi:hypothetical protein